MNADRPLCVEVQLTDGDMGETITESVVIHPSEGDNKLRILNEQAKQAVKNATEKMDERYSQDIPTRDRTPIEACPKCEGHGGIVGDRCERCEGTGRADKESNI